MSMYSQGFIPDGSITDAKVAALAAIAMSKLNLAITDAQVAAGAAIAKSKLATLGIVDADVAAGAAIAKSKLAALGIVDADVAAGAAIAKSKLNISTWAGLSDSAPGAKIASGSYVGDGTANRAIAHSLGTTPKWVFLKRAVATPQFISMHNIDSWNIYSSAGAHVDNYTQTGWDATNFYANSYVNNNGDTYYWVAMG